MNTVTKRLASYHTSLAATSLLAILWTTACREQSQSTRSGGTTVNSTRSIDGGTYKLFEEDVCVPLPADFAILAHDALEDRDRILSPHSWLLSVPHVYVEDIVAGIGPWPRIPVMQNDASRIAKMADDVRHSDGGDIDTSRSVALQVDCESRSLQFKMIQRSREVIIYIESVNIP